MSAIYYEPRRSGKTTKIKKEVSILDPRSTAIFVHHRQCIRTEYFMFENVYWEVDKYLRDRIDRIKPNKIYIDEYDLFSTEEKKKLWDLYEEGDYEFIIRGTRPTLNIEVIKLIRELRGGKNLMSFMDEVRSLTQYEIQDFNELEYHFAGHLDFLIQITETIFKKGE